MAKPTTTNEQDSEICDLYLSGLSMDKTAEATNTSRMIVTRILKNNNIVIRSCAPVRPYNVISQAFDNLNDERSAYWLGFLYADGTVKRTCLNVALIGSDIEHLQKLSSFLGCNDHATLNIRGHAWLQVSDRYLAERLISLGVEPHRPRSIQSFNAVPENMRHHFLRGCFDGDGSILIKPQIMIVGRLPFLQAIQDEFITRNLANPVSIKDEHDTWGKLYYKGIHRCLAITNYLYRDATIWLERKRDRVNKWAPPQRSKQSKYWKS